MLGWAAHWVSQRPSMANACAWLARPFLTAVFGPCHASRAVGWPKKHSPKSHLYP
uniref:Uncharacterized protein n=1 Tax=Arundo donax TaxID=35708 RepID=A0A0A9G9A2_ARUDO